MIKLAFISIAYVFVVFLLFVVSFSAHAEEARDVRKCILRADLGRQVVWAKLLGKDRARTKEVVDYIITQHPEAGVPVSDIQAVNLMIDRAWSMVGEDDVEMVALMQRGDARDSFIRPIAGRVSNKLFKECAFGDGAA